MAIYQGIGTFGSYQYITGGSLTFSRGVRPSRAILRKIPVDALTFSTGSLVLTYGPVTISLPNCAVAEVRNRHWYGREGWMQDVVVLDRRWKWRYCHIDGVYNERAYNGTIQTANKKNIKELIELCLDALGETGYITTDVPTDVYPPCLWNRARADLELQWLCDLVGMVVSYQVLDEKIAIKKMNDTSGASLPAGNIATPPQRYKQSVIPYQITVQADPTLIQSELTLEAVGLETDGTIVPIDDLSYKPAAGWTYQWYDWFGGVDQDYRHLAFKSVFRWYRPTGGWIGDGVTINDYKQLELLPHLAECGTDEDGIYRPLPARIRGVYWPQCDYIESTDETAPYAGPFTIDTEKGIVVFERPVIQWDDVDEIAEAELYLTCAYRVRNPDFDGYSCYTYTVPVSSATTTTEARILPHPELRKTLVWNAVYGSPGDNETQIEAEADRYADMVEAIYDYPYSDERVYDGFVAQDTGGAIAQVQWWWGHSKPAMTRIGRMTEFDIYQATYRQNRAMERLAQIAGRMSL